jgi:hypothetical protein
LVATFFVVKSASFFQILTIHPSSAKTLQLLQFPLFRPNGGTAPGSLSLDELVAYRKAWRQMRSTLQAMQTPFGNPGQVGGEGRGNPIPPAKPIQQWTWAEYYGYILSRGEYAPQHYSVIGRLRMIRSVQSLFAEGRHFEQIDQDGRNRIAGTLHPRYGIVEGVNYLWFGSMWPGSRLFYEAGLSSRGHIR